MPVTVTVYAIGAWFCVGLFTAMGWALGGWAMGKLCAAIDRASQPRA